MLDHSIIQWQLDKTQESYGHAHKRLTGHSHFVSDLVLSSDAQFALSSSWGISLDFGEILVDWFQMVPCVFGTLTTVFPPDVLRVTLRMF